MQWFRTELERKGSLPTTSVITLQNHFNQRWITLFKRWRDNVGRGSVQHKLNEDWQHTIRKMWIELYGSLPTVPLPSHTGNHAPYPIALTDAEKNDPNKFDIVDAGERDENEDRSHQHKDDDDDDDSDACDDEEPIDGGSGSDGDEGDNSAGGNGDADDNRAPKRIQSIWNRKVDEVLKKLAYSQNEMPHRTSSNYSTSFIDQHIPLSNQLCNKVKKALLTDSKTRVARFRDSGAIDMKRLPDIARLTDIQNVYQNVTHGKALNSCVQIYIDASGSMHTTTTDSNGFSIGYVMEVAAATAAVLSNTFDFLKIPHQLITYDDTPYVIKNWRSKWKDSQLKHVMPTASTNIPYSLRCGLPQMMNRREKRKIAIVITDGDMSSHDDFYEVGGDLERFKRKGVELYAIGLGVQVVCSDPKNPTVDYTGCVGVGDRIQRYPCKKHYELGGDPNGTYVGFNGGIDNVKPDSLLRQLSQHLVHVFTEGRQVVR